ncbi:MAG: SLC13 family permease [Thermoanaerobaculia bacterium]
MTFAIAYVLLLLVVALGLFIWDYLSVDIVGLIVLLLLTIPGILSAKDAIAAFGDTTIIVLIGLFVLTTGVVKTGVVERFGLRLAGLGGKNPNRLLRFVLPVVTALGVGLSNTERTAVFLPIVIGIARRAAVPLSRVLMLLAFAALLGGGLTVISTSTNLLVSSQLPRYGLEPIGFFEMTAVGACIAIVGLMYVLFVAPRLLPDRSQPEMTGQYDLRRYLSEAVITRGSRLAGKTLAQSGLGAANLNVIGIVRDKDRILAPGPRAQLREGDVLIIEGKAEDILSVKDREGIDIRPEVKLSDFDLQSEDVRMMEAMVFPRSDLVGRTLEESSFRERFGLTALALHTAGGADRIEKISRQRLKASDVLLLQGHSEDFRRLREGEDLMLLEDVSGHHPRSGRGKLAGGIFVFSILLGASGAVSLPVAFLLGGLLLVLTRCVTTQEAYEAVPWHLLVMIACMISFGLAMEKSGAAAFLAGGIVELARPLGPMAVLAGFFFLTIILTQPMSNQAAALVVLPVAITVARQLELNPRSLVMAVTFAASCSFLTPLEPSCLLVYGPGRYKFFDFARVGAPLTVLVFVVAMILIPMFWPLDAKPSAAPKESPRAERVERPLFTGRLGLPAPHQAR